MKDNGKGAAALKKDNNDKKRFPLKREPKINIEKDENDAVKNPPKDPPKRMADLIKPQSDKLSNN